MKKIQVLTVLLFVYVLSVGLINMVQIPDPGTKIKLPELVFPILAVAWGIVFYRQFPVILKPGPLDWSILSYIATVFFAAAANSGLHSWLEAIAILYLYGVLVIFRSSFHLLPDPMGWITTAFTVTGLLAALLGIVGYILHFFNIPNLFVSYSDCYYGYFGEMIRAVGYMATPNMLHNFLGICLLLFLPGYLQNDFRKAHHHLILLVLLSAILLTISKDILLLAAAVLFLVAHLGIQKRNRLAWKMMGILLFIICMGGTHLLIEKKTAYTKHLSMEQGCYEKDIWLEAGPCIVRFTNYTTNKIAAIRAGIEEVPFGTGPGNFNNYVSQLKSMDLYPTYFINFDPHCTYTGAFGELGLIGLLALFFMLFQTVRTLIATAALNDQKSRQISLGLTSCFLFMAMEAMILDTLHFRYIWILFAILTFLLERKNMTTLDPNKQRGITSQTTS